MFLYFVSRQSAVVFVFSPFTCRRRLLDAGVRRCAYMVVVVGSRRAVGYNVQLLSNFIR